MDAVEAWEVGWIKDGVFYADVRYQRSFQQPRLMNAVWPEDGLARAVMVTDAAGVRRAFVRKE